MAISRVARVWCICQATVRISPERTADLVLVVASGLYENALCLTARAYSSDMIDLAVIKVTCCVSPRLNVEQSLERRCHILTSVVFNCNSESRCGSAEQRQNSGARKLLAQLILLAISCFQYTGGSGHNTDH